VGPYFPTGLRAIDLFIEESAARAWPGGVGQFKVGGNYAPTIQPQMRAAQAYGTQQVVYTHRLPAGAQNSGAGTGDLEDAEFEESGAMNIFFLLDKPGGRGTELVTPDLRGTILPGITRDSILALCRQWGEFDVAERPVTLREMRAAANEGRLREIFGSGTACVVQPVGGLMRANGEIWRPYVSDPSSTKALAPRLQRALLDIQYGRTPHPWSVVIE
jgi:branched-chain amino acid aminotransferase